MTGRERILMTISHKEPDRIPIDLAATHATTIHIKAYKALLDYLGYTDRKIETAGVLGQLAEVDEDILEKFGIDTRGLWARLIFSGGPEKSESGITKTDEWGIKWFMPDDSGYFYDMISHPLKDSSMEEIKKYKWPVGDDPRRFTGLDELVQNGVANHYAMVFGTTIGNGFLQTGNWLESFEDFFCDLALDSPKVEFIMDKMLGMKMQFWDAILEKWGDKLDIVQEQDDMGTQTGLLISPELYRKMIKPRQKILFDHIKKKAPHIKLLFHSCGSIRPIIPDLIEVGVDILNPVQVSATGMEPTQLKKDFGRDITFWGGGIDTQYTLPKGSVEDVKNEVRRHIDEFKPGGGFVFAPVHNIQAEVPPENLIAMWETILKYGKY